MKSTPEFIIKGFSQCFSRIFDSNFHLTNDFRLPSFDIQTVNCVLDQVKLLFITEPTLLQIQSPISVVGDLHGNLFDLVRIQRVIGPFAQTKYLFLGDIIDRGEFSFETIFLIFTLKILYPLNVFIIRGNHETKNLSTQYGFRQNILDLYQSDSLYSKFVDVFSFLPIAAVIDNSYFCVHGGIGQNIKKAQQISQIKRPLSEKINAKTHQWEENSIFSDLLWSDPSELINTFSLNDRGIGFFFGKKAVDKFLKKSHLQKIIRSHTAQKNGYTSFFDGKVISLFSCSNYCGTYQNSSSIATINSVFDLEVKQFPFIPLIKRSMFSFISNEILTLTRPLSMPILRLQISKNSLKFKKLRRSLVNVVKQEPD